MNASEKSIHELMVWVLKSMGLVEARLNRLVAEGKGSIEDRARESAEDKVLTNTFEIVVRQCAQIEV